MAENYSVFLVAWLFLLLLGGCVLVNAMIDLTVHELRRWVSRRRAAALPRHRAVSAKHP